MQRVVKKNIPILCIIAFAVIIIIILTKNNNYNETVSIVTVGPNYNPSNGNFIRKITKLQNDNSMRKIRQLPNDNFIKKRQHLTSNGNLNRVNRKWELQQFYNELQRTIHGNLQNFPKVFTYNNGWKLNTKVCDEYFRTIPTEDLQKYYIYNLITPQGIIPIYTHDPEKDLISNKLRIRSEGIKNIDDAILSLMKPFSDSILIDAGSNLGIHTLHVLKAGKSAISLEASEANVQHLCLTAAVNNLSQNLTIIFNAAGARHGNIQFAIGPKGNQGSNFVVEPSILKLKTSRERWIFPKVEPINVPLVRLDDILDLPISFNKNSRICIKMDVEGYEDAVLEGAGKLFNQTHVVKGVVMEWTWHKSRESGRRIITFMRQYNFSPYSLRGVELNSEFNYSNWPNDVMWIPMT